MALSEEVESDIRMRIGALLREKGRPATGEEAIRALEDLYATGLDQLVTEFGHHFKPPETARDALSARIDLALLSRISTKGPVQGS